LYTPSIPRQLNPALCIALVAKSRVEMWCCAMQGRLDVLKLLIAAGADVNTARDDEGCTPLYMAAQKGHAGVVDLFIAAGANVNAARTSDGATALSTALRRGHAEVVQKLRAAGAN
jgi:ankyrin repeat protein